MNRNTILHGLVLAAVLGMGAAARAEGANQGGEAADAKTLLTAKVTAVQAAQAAELKLGGKTLSVSFERGEGNAPFYHVEIVTPDGAQQDVAVDVSSGEIAKVLTSEEDDSGERGESHEFSGRDDPDGDGEPD